MWYNNFIRLAEEHPEFSFMEKTPTAPLRADEGTVNRVSTVIAVMLLQEFMSSVQKESVIKALRELKTIKDQGRWPLATSVGATIVRKMDVATNHPVYGKNFGATQEEKAERKRIALDRLRDIMTEIVK